MNVAGMSKLLVEKFKLGVGGSLTEQHAYMAWLFHDCAIPLLMKKFNNYSDIVGLPIQNNPLITMMKEYTFTQIIVLLDI